MEPSDVTVIGGGILGTSMPYWLASRYEGRIAILERERGVALHTSRRNTGVVHRVQVYADEKRPDVGHFFMALDPAAFQPLDEFTRDMDRLARELKDSPKAQGQDRIYVHGEKSFARMETFRREGIPLDPKVVEGLRKIGADLDVPWPA